MINNIKSSQLFTSKVFFIDNGDAYSKLSNPVTHPDVDLQGLQRAVTWLENNDKNDIVTIKVLDNNNFQLQVKQMIGSTAFIGNAKLNKINAKSAAAAYLEANKNMYPLSRAKLAEYII